MVAQVTYQVKPNQKNNIVISYRSLGLANGQAIGDRVKINVYTYAGSVGTVVKTLNVPNNLLTGAFDCVEVDVGSNPCVGLEAIWDGTTASPNLPPKVTGFMTLDYCSNTPLTCPDGYYKQTINGCEYCVCKCVDATYIGFGGSGGTPSQKNEVISFIFHNKYIDINTAAGAWSTSNYTLTGDAVIASGNLTLNENIYGAGGNIWTKNPIRISDDSLEVVDFYAIYAVRMTGASLASRADGISFIIQSYSNAAGGHGGAIGYGGITKSIAVSLDTYQNWMAAHGIDDISNNHVELNVNGSMDSIAKMDVPFELAGYTGNPVIVYVWVDYVAATKNLKVYVNNTYSKPGSPFLNQTIDLKTYLTYLNTSCTNCDGIAPIKLNPSCVDH